MKLAHIHQIAIYAKDLTEAVEFYRDTLGAALLAQFDSPGLAFLNFSGVRILLERRAPKSTIYFKVDDIQQAYTHLAAQGVPFSDAPRVIHRDAKGVFGPPGEEEWMAFFSDPSGNLLALAARKLAPA